MKTIKLLTAFTLILISFSCKKEIIKVDKIVKTESTIKYAKGFDIINKNGVKKLIIKSAYKNSNEVFEYIIKSKNDKKATQLNTISTPINKIVRYFYNPYSYGRIVK